MLRFVGLLGSLRSSEEAAAIIKPRTNPAFSLCPPEGMTGHATDYGCGLINT